MSSSLWKVGNALLPSPLAPFSVCSAVRWVACVLFFGSGGRCGEYLLLQVRRERSRKGNGELLRTAI
ncbi:hypothetical protein Taro_028472 [Colocasia esculenta]|uniref:Uncharacterized protein n=1 Tax=Colocasia esculenta TaxID=4460 RepID=A0A843VN92_COLES|nr:hypothetical protein [Colocasia esculenta]